MTLRRTARLDGLPGLLCAAVALELALALGIALPLAIRLHPYVVVSPQSLAIVLGTGAGGAAKFGIAAVALFAAFGVALWLARKASGRVAHGAVLAATLAFSLTLLPVNPLGAHDIYHDIADARTFWVYHQDPSVVPPSAHSSDWFTPAVPSWRTTPSAYGPVWYGLSGAGLALTGRSLWGSVLAQKVLAAAFLLALTTVAMLLAQRIEPGSAVGAGVLVGWNPLLQFETAGNAHNDVVMVFFACLAAYAALRRGWPLVFPLLALSVATKPVLILLGPLLLAYMLGPGRARGRQVALSLALGGAVLAALYAPFFHGASTIAGLHREAGHVTSSPGAVVHDLLTLGTGLGGIPALRLMQVVAWPPCLLAYALCLLYVLTSRAPQVLIVAAFWTVFALLTVLSWWFMPWYLFWLVPFAAALPGRRPLLLAAVFSGAAMLTYVPHFWLLGDNQIVVDAVTAATAFLPPIMALLATTRWRPGPSRFGASPLPRARRAGWAAGG